MFRYGWSQALFIDETLEDSLQRLARFGYDGVELPVLSMLPKEVRDRLNHHGLSCTSVNGRFVGHDRDLSSSDESVRAAAVSYVRSCLQFAAHIGAPVAIIVPTRIGKLSPETSLAKEWDNVVRSLREIGEIGQGLGVTAVIECVNRAESYLANRLETAHRLVKDTGSQNVALMADSFHMNIEETDVHGALRAVATHLKHVHLADNNRTAPGMGHLHLSHFLDTLFSIGYRGAVVMECDVQAPDQYGRNALTTDRKIFDQYTETAIATLKRMEASLKTKVAI
ncbi:sugar phosphate isomerase/epimerase family protein [Rhizobium sp. AG207R]|uniref:sugar phosphate isomerase/epimerase family protein n=1 Tax=Rhizobium sp. AG207R TaxID=2802287 RepID=UPI0022AC8216|nr:sugar phosphate isomerase/epimerase family protein [Rhizobium sp. AG207R]MCZ3374362.1 sugar phosphate isomerase/epimerase [Rhizobium sp. AG207R]